MFATIRNAISRFTNVIIDESKKAWSHPVMRGPTTSSPFAFQSGKSLFPTDGYDARTPARPLDTRLSFQNNIPDQARPLSTGQLAAAVKVFAQQAAIHDNRIDISVPRDVADRFTAGEGYFALRTAISAELETQPQRVIVAPKGSRAVLTILF